MFDLAIRTGHVVTDAGVEVADIAVQGGQIAAIGAELDLGATEIDATGKYVVPGGVDPHCHIEQMSGMCQMNADTFETATRSVAMGGTTSVISFAAQRKGQRLTDVIADYTARAKRGAAIDHAFHISVSDTAIPGLEQDLGALIAAGHRSIKVFTTHDIALGDYDILKLMALAHKHGALVCVHAENHGLIQWTRAALLEAGRPGPNIMRCRTPAWQRSRRSAGCAALPNIWISQ